MSGERCPTCGGFEGLGELQAARRGLARATGRRYMGVSSDALVFYGFGIGPRPRTPGTPATQWNCSWQGDECGDRHPHDRGDLAACERTYSLAPPEAQERMLPVLVEFRAWVCDGINRYGVKVRDGYGPLPDLETSPW